MTTKKRKNHKLDREIERLYGIHAVGKQIDIMDIGKVFKAGEEAHTAGESIEEAIKLAIEKWCVTPCPNCGQWQRGNGDCMNECVKRGFAPKVERAKSGVTVVVV
jgi:hypothetical protein